MTHDAVQIHFITASCENMIDGKGLRPGDILTGANGTTVEVSSPHALLKISSYPFVDTQNLAGTCVPDNIGQICHDLMLATMWMTACTRYCNPCCSLCPS